MTLIRIFITKTKPQVTHIALNMKTNIYFAIIKVVKTKQKANNRQTLPYETP